VGKKGGVQRAHGVQRDERKTGKVGAKDNKRLFLDSTPFGKNQKQTTFLRGFVKTEVDTKKSEVARVEKRIEAKGEMYSAPWGITQRNDSLLTGRFGQREK